MNLYRKSALLSLLRQRLDQDREADWQTLQERERRWYRAQSAENRWSVAASWLAEFSGAATGPVTSLAWLMCLVGFAAGAALVAGLLEFRSFERINLLWFMALAILLPLVFWIAGMLAAAGRGSFPVFALVEHRLPGWMRSEALARLLRQTAVVMSQQISLAFAVGMMLTWLLYLIVTDLAFGWSSTLDISASSLHTLTTVMAWPWQRIWPEAVPTLALLESTRYFRAAPVAADPATAGAWWRFLSMCLLTYVLLPRLAGFLYHRTRLALMQKRLFEVDALIAGWWQRMTSERLFHDAGKAEPMGEVREVEPDTTRLPVCPHVVLWGIWPDEPWRDVKQKLHARIPDFQLYKLQDKALLETTITGTMRNSADPVLIVCKGWEPPSGELNDFCQHIAGRAPRYIWPVPLAGMDATRTAQLNRSWRAFVPTLPENFHLLAGEPHD